MPASKLAIINAAFGHLGEPHVDEITQDPKPQKVVRALDAWPLALDHAAARAPWLCCLHRLTINRSGDIAGDWQYDYAYELPVDTLRVWTVADDGAPFRWERSTVLIGQFVGRPIIRAESEGPLKVALTRRPLPEFLTPALTDALAYELAHRLAGPIQSDAAKAAELRKLADQAYLLAMGAEAGEHRYEDPVITSPMTDARWEC